jgi:hypothetical protein
MYVHMSWPPEISSSRDFISSFRHFESKFRWNFSKAPWKFSIHFGIEFKEQISTLTSEIWFVFYGKISRFLLNQEQNQPFWRKKLQGVPDKVIHYICQKIEPLWPLFQISFVRMETTYYKDKPQEIVWWNSIFKCS